MQLRLKFVSNFMQRKTHHTHTHTHFVHIRVSFMRPFVCVYTNRLMGLFCGRLEYRCIVCLGCRHISAAFRLHIFIVPAALTFIALVIIIDVRFGRLSECRIRMLCCKRPADNMRLFKFFVYFLSAVVVILQNYYKIHNTYTHIMFNVHSLIANGSNLFWFLCLLLLKHSRKIMCILCMYSRRISRT